MTCLRNIGESSSLANCIFYSNRGFARCSCWSWSKSRYGLALSRHECSISESKSRTATRPFAGPSSSLRFGREPKTLAQRQPWSSRLHVILILMCWVLSLPYLCVLVSLLLLTSQQGKWNEERKKVKVYWELFNQIFSLIQPKFSNPMCVTDTHLD